MCLSKISIISNNKSKIFYFDFYSAQFKIFILILLLIPSFIYPIELILKNNEVYICDFLSEDETNMKVRYKDRVYNIPKKDILNFDHSKLGSHSSSYLSVVILFEGSEIRGIIVEEDSQKITIYSDIDRQMVKYEKYYEPYLTFFYQIFFL